MRKGRGKRLEKIELLIIAGFVFVFEALGERTSVWLLRCP